MRERPIVYVLAREAQNRMSNVIEIGRVHAIHRYPVKSMRGESLQQAKLRWTGIDGDRQYAFVRTANGSRFPWLTAREVPELVLYRARFAEPDDPRRSALTIATPDGVTHPVQSPELAKRLSEAAGEDVRMIQIGRGVFDSMPISVVSTITPGLVGGCHGRPVDIRRFRPNIEIEPVDAQTERSWLSGSLVFGDGHAPARLRVNCPIERCAMIAVDPDTASRDPALVKTVVRNFGNEIGVYAGIEAVGTIAVGDPVRLVGD